MPPPPNPHPATLSERCVGRVFGILLRMLASTWRVEYQGLDALNAIEQAGQPHVLVFWHRHYITLFRLFRNRPMLAITNPSHRGQIIGEICRRNGMQVLQAQGTLGTIQSLEQASHAGLGLAIAADGPLGPAGEVKRVVLRLAARLECPVIPVSVAVQRKRVIASRWDRLEIPHLFTRVAFVVGTPVSVANDATRSLKDIAAELKRAIEEGTETGVQLASR